MIAIIARAENFLLENAVDNNWNNIAIRHLVASLIAELEKSKHKTIAIECYMVSCKHCHGDLYCKNPHSMSIQLCNLGVPQCEGYEEEV